MQPIYQKVNETVQEGEPTGNTMGVGYFPFDDWNENKDEVTPALETEHPYNHQHGLTMECKFYLPESGKADGDDIFFRFSGDDDAWLFIDDVLVLDVGGLHLPLGGSVNLTTGEVTVDSAVDVVPWEADAKVTPTNGTENTLSAIFEAAGKEWDPAAEHTFKFFYLERGGCYSNLALATNFAKLSTISRSSSSDSLRTQTKHIMSNMSNIVHHVMRNLDTKMSQYLRFIILISTTYDTNQLLKGKHSTKRSSR